jgi:hypothetical protein
MPVTFLKLAPYLVAIALLIGAFFTGYKAGSNKQKVIIQERIIKSGERHADIEQRQSKRVASRGQRLHIDRLRDGSF